LGRGGRGVDLVDRGLESGGDIGVGGLVEAHVAVADLHKAEIALRLLFADRGKPAQAVGLQHTAVDHAQGPGSGPGHALEKTAAINAVMVVIVQNLIFLVVVHAVPPFTGAGFFQHAPWCTWALTSWERKYSPEAKHVPSSRGQLTSSAKLSVQAWRRDKKKRPQQRGLEW